MVIEILRKVLEKNDAAASQNRDLLTSRGILCVNLLGGAGSGKTTLLEALLPLLEGRLRAAVLEGDLATTCDAERIAALGVPVIQLLTDGSCHLTATHVQRGLERLPLGEADLVVIENVGNPICPANFDLGEHVRISILSAAEGDDKPAKYALLFRRADAIAITKCDLIPHVAFDIERAVADLRRINPSARVFLTEIRGGESVEQLADWLVRRRDAVCATQSSPEPTAAGAIGPRP